MFRILIVDDNPASAALLRDVMKNIRRPYELYYAKDGIDALDFLHRRGDYADAPRPNLILLDMQMPRLNGLETLSSIKHDPELCVLPVIMLSTAASLEDVRKSYQNHANCYVQKPANLEQSVKFVQSVEAFWMDFALPASPDRRLRENHPAVNSKVEDRSSGGLERFGKTIAPPLIEAISRASTDGPLAKRIATLSSFDCDDQRRLLGDFAQAVLELSRLHEQQFLAIVEGDTECQRFDILIHMASEKKQLAKYVYLRHVDSHDCSKTDAID